MDAGLEAYFQAFIMKLNYACASLEPLFFDTDPDITWRVYLDLKQHDTTSQVPLALSDLQDIKIQSSYLTPVHTLFTDNLKMELVVHEKA